ncbi:MAG: type V CRISPR-associated protein Cpf1, partial [Candidatus Yonathbacteria bacterium CG_4_9_14_0_2_um_filter_47_74]
LYLFKIHNKDFGEKSKGTQNTHTLYFLNLFSQHNLTHIKLRLAGNAEVFYRKSSTQRKEEQRKFIRPIVKNKRFTEDKYFFHIPIKIGASVNSISETKFNRTLNEKLRQSACLIIGIDRGEKHLAYYSVINQKGEIVDQASLNKINDVDYCEKLRTREKERLEQRKSWKAISQIKDLKRGYISQVIHKLSELVIKHNAIIVFEDLNMRFKEVRGGIERSAYQQLEKALIEKFGYLVFKDKDPLEAGGVLNGYQLSAPFESFEKMGKQNGVIFYTNPEYTSTTDPVTGWRQHIYIKSDATDNEALKVFTEKIGIGWSDDKQSYTFSYDQKDFWEDSPARKWVLYANAPRLERYRNDAGYWTTRETNSNDLLRELFEVWDFDQPEGDISEQIAMMYEEGKLKGEKIISEKSQRFFKALRYALNLTQQIRNSDSIRYVYERDAQGDIVEDSQGKMVVKEIGENVDFIASPVVPFFTTPNPYTKENLCGLVIENGDANGAYNIARKGIMMLERIKQTQANPDLYISKSDWDEWLMKDIKQK